MKIAKLKPNPDNPRFIRDDRFEKLKASLSDFPKMMELRPIIYEPTTMIVLGGNMRLRALQELGYTDIPDEWARSAKGLTADEKRRFTVLDNSEFGEWDFDALANMWDAEELAALGLELDAFVKETEMPTDFTLPDGDREPFQSITFTLSDAQAEAVKSAISRVQKTDEFKYMESDNENSNGNALALIVEQWDARKK